MQIKAPQLKSFYKSVPAQYKALLVFGPDEGAVREAFVKVSQAVVPDIKDAFSVVELTPASLKDSPSAIYDGAAEGSLLGGRKLVRVAGADDTVADGLDFYLSHYEGDAFVVLAAGDLPKKSRLRKLAEAGGNIACFAAYNDTPEALRGLIFEELQAAGKWADNAAVAWLSDNMGADRGVSRSEIAKLITYAGDEDEITLDMAREVVGDGSAADTDAFIFAMGAGDFAAMDKALARLFAEGDDGEAVRLVRAAMYHFQRLLLTKARIEEEGAGVETAMRQLYPPVFWKVDAAFRAQLKTWSVANLVRVLRYLTEVERDCKLGGTVPATLASAAFINICRLAKRV